MENETKGTKYDVRNNCRYCWYCSDSHQYYRHIDQYHTVLQKTKTSKKQPHPTKVMVAFLISN